MDVALHAKFGPD